jgi:hypothetical protein
MSGSVNSSFKKRDETEYYWGEWIVMYITHEIHTFLELNVNFSSLNL